MPNDFCFTNKVYDVTVNVCLTALGNVKAAYMCVCVTRYANFLSYACQNENGEKIGDGTLDDDIQIYIAYQRMCERTNQRVCV